MDVDAFCRRFDFFNERFIQAMKMNNFMMVFNISKANEDGLAPLRSNIELMLNDM
jgi:hypothetical protein